MRLYHIVGPEGLSALQLQEAAEPTCGPYDVLVDMRAWSMNYRDLIMLQGGYPRNDKVLTGPPMIPLSDGAGEVIAIGPAVTRFRVGDRVAGIFFAQWLDGDLTDEQIGSALGGAVDGVLAERIIFHENAVVHVPPGYNYEQAATLPCAAVTAWQALRLGHCHGGQSVLMLGTGGVSIFALQFAKSFGARTIITSSNDEKLARARELGANETINYRTHPDWQNEVLRLTGGRGVDHVIEVGGAGTLERSLMATRVSGRVSLIGVLTGQPESNPSPMPILFKRLTLQGIYVGSREMFEDMNQTIHEKSIEPVIDQRFDFMEALEAYSALRSGQHFGKIVITR